MKTKSLFYSTANLLLLSVVLWGCSGAKKEEVSDDSQTSTEQAADSDAVSEPQFQVDKKFQDQLADVFTSYVSLKDAFVASDVAVVKGEAVKTTDALSKLDVMLLSGAAHNDGIYYLTAMGVSLTMIAVGGDISAQRQAFSKLSDELYKSVKAFGLGGKEAFYEFCPMAFNNEGGYWLSDKEVIRNPYFGDEMLTCGSVKEKLK